MNCPVAVVAIFLQYEDVITSYVLFLFIECYSKVKSGLEVDTTWPGAR